MALDQVSDKSVWQIFVTFSNQSYLLTDQVFSVLENKLGVSIDYLHYITGFHVEVFPEEVEQADEVADFASEQTLALLWDLDNLLLSEAVLAELAHKLLYLVYLAEVEVGEGAEYLIDLSLWHLMVKVEQKLNLLDLLLQILPADQLGALKQRAHWLLVWNALSFHCFEVLIEFLLGLAQNVGVPYDHGANWIHLETFLVHEETLEGLDTGLFAINENKFGIVSHDKGYFLL
jgi:hypothetical protein